MQKPINNAFDTNAVQFFILGFIILLILADKSPVLIDIITKKHNYRFSDGWGDAIKDFCYFMASGITLLTIKFRKSKADFIAVLVFVTCFLLSIFSMGIYKFLAQTIMSSIMFLYIISSFIRKSNQQKHFSKANNKKINRL